MNNKAQMDLLSCSLHVLVVEDNQLVRQMLAIYLTSDGHTVETATNGQEGLEKFHAGQFDLVITDQVMPQMSGEQLAVAIKRVTPDKPILMLTGFDSPASPLGQNPGCVDAIVSKPVTLTVFQETLKRMIGKS